MVKGRIGRLAAAVRDQRGRIVSPASGAADDARATASPDPTDDGVGSVDPSPNPGATAADPGTAFQPGGSAPRAKRGRPPGSRTDPGRAAPRKRAPQESSVRVRAKRGSVSTYIIEAHEFLAELTDIKRLELRQDQADKLGAAIENVEQHFPVVQLLTGKWAAIAALCWCAGRIYLPMAKDIAAGQLDVRASSPSPVAQRMKGGAVPAGPAAPGSGAPGSGMAPVILPVLDQTASPEDLAREWLHS